MAPEFCAPRWRPMLDFEPEPSVRRVVFICAPHRGSNTANRFVGRLASMLVRRPGDIETLHAEAIRLNGPDVFTPAYRRRPPSSIDNLEPESPILQMLSRHPLPPGVPVPLDHRQPRPGPTPPALWTDGVVSYGSVHLAGAQSEILVKHGHSANVTPEATAEVHRILRLHLGFVR